MIDVFDATKLGNSVLKNRFVRSATCEGLSDSNGHITEDLIKLYADLAKGGVGSIITSYACILDGDKSSHGQLGIYDDSFIDEYKKLTSEVHKYDNANSIQWL